MLLSIIIDINDFFVLIIQEVHSFNIEYKAVSLHRSKEKH